MATRGRPGAAYGSPEHLERLRRGARRANQRRRELELVSPSDLRSLRKGRAIPARLRPVLDAAAETIAEIRRAAEGEPGSGHNRPLSPQRIALLEAAQRLLALGQAETARAFQAADGEAASRAGTLLARFAQLVEKAVGLERRELEVPSLSDYLRDRAGQGANGSAGDAEPGSTGDRAQARPGGPSTAVGTPCRSSPGRDPMRRVDGAPAADAGVGQ